MQVVEEKKGTEFNTDNVSHFAHFWRDQKKSKT